jgi:hypothetical protein
MLRSVNMDSTEFVTVSTIAFIDGEKGTEAMAKLTLVSCSDDVPFPAYSLGCCRTTCMITCYK